MKTFPKENYKLRTTGFIIVDQDNKRVSQVFGDRYSCEYFTSRSPYNMIPGDSIAELV